MTHRPVVRAQSRPANDSATTKPRKQIAGGSARRARAGGRNAPLASSARGRREGEERDADDEEGRDHRAGLSAGQGDHGHGDGEADRDPRTPQELGCEQREPWSGVAEAGEQPRPAGREGQSAVEVVVGMGPVEPPRTDRVRRGQRGAAADGDPFGAGPAALEHPPCRYRRHEDERAGVGRESEAGEGRARGERDP